MMLSEVFLLVIVFYLLYRFVFNFLVPIAKATRHMRHQFRNMQDGMGGQHQRQQPNDWQQPTSDAQQRHSSTKGPAEDYIEFEEIRSPPENR